MGKCLKDMNDNYKRLVNLQASAACSRDDDEIQRQDSVSCKHNLSRACEKIIEVMILLKVQKRCSEHLHRLHQVGPCPQQLCSSREDPMLTLYGFANP